MTWKLMRTWPGNRPDDLLAEGTEAEVKARAMELVRETADDAAEAFLRADMYLVKPDGSCQGQRSHGDFFTRGEPIDWMEVEWL